MKPFLSPIFADLKRVNKRYISNGIISAFSKLWGCVPCKSENFRCATIIITANITSHHTMDIDLFCIYRSMKIDEIPFILKCTGRKLTECNVKLEKQLEPSENRSYRTKNRVKWYFIWFMLCVTHLHWSFLASFFSSCCRKLSLTSFFEATRAPRKKPTSIKQSFSLLLWSHTSLEQLNLGKYI